MLVPRARQVRHRVSMYASAEQASRSGHRVFLKQASRSGHQRSGHQRSITPWTSSPRHPDRTTIRTREPMRVRLPATYGAPTRASTLAFQRQPRTRPLVTLAIETSCDDTAVSILQSGTFGSPATTVAKLHFHEKVTSNNAAFNGVHPLAALESHQENLANLVAKAIQKLPEKNTRPDFVSVTRGPGMRSNLFTGLDTAKGLAAAWKASEVAWMTSRH